ncbi:MAG: DUF938 domain-containing protein [Rhodospirillaceae bacterium]|nr:DUF938 domain-containing protein [Rhodospirillaceae bacterium]MYH35393.1 DUF938 domain-containing protein [Rhodospirillaceae bacterium]MYK15133.1 DUF938 domain-containing protein [Rhodospirillaceae bacterium]MYK60278.1 DUF938 domain-containing protein [Rhodospirillaceae bacterium]
MTAMHADRRRHAPAAARNRDPIAAVVLPRLLQGTRALEIGSGTGEHVVHMAALRPDTSWQPSDPDPACRESIAAWTAHTGLANVAPPLDLDVRLAPWPVAEADFILCCNLIHIAPWPCTAALLQGAGRLLDAGGELLLYGPFKRGGAHTAPSNAAFDAALRREDPDWGVRDLEAVAVLAAENGLSFVEAVPMPANNFCAVFRKAEPGKAEPGRTESRAGA